MAKYRLRSDHIIDNRIVPAGTEVGTDTDIPFDQVPSNQMEGLDDEGREKVNELHRKLYGADAPWHTEEAEAKRKADQEALEEQQRQERESGLAGHVSATPVSGSAPSPTQSLTKGGDTSGGPGVAQPRTDQSSVQPVTKPLEEQLPKE